MTRASRRLFSVREPPQSINDDEAIPSSSDSSGCSRPRGNRPLGDDGGLASGGWHHSLSAFPRPAAREPEGGVDFPLIEGVATRMASLLHIRYRSSRPRAGPMAGPPGRRRYFRAFKGTPASASSADNPDSSILRPGRTKRMPAGREGRDFADPVYGTKQSRRIARRKSPTCEGPRTGFGRIRDRSSLSEVHQGQGSSFVNGGAPNGFGIGANGRVAIIAAVGIGEIFAARVVEAVKKLARISPDGGPGCSVATRQTGYPQLRAGFSGSAIGGSLAG